MASAKKKPAAKKRVAARTRSTKKEMVVRKSPRSRANKSTRALGIADILPDEESRRMFILGCVCLGQADGQIHEGEKAFFINAAVGMGLGQEHLTEIGEWLEDEQDPDDVTFESVQQALFFLRESLQMCYLDGHFSESERECLSGICRRAGVSRASFEYIEDWVRDGMAWRLEGDTLLSLEG